MNDVTIISRTPVKRNFFPPKKIKETDYKLGAAKIPRVAHMPVGGEGWDKFLPIGETQSKNNIDPNSCPVGGTQNIIEALGLKQYKKLGFQSDLSERYPSIIMGMEGFGGNPWHAAEIMHWYGNVPEVFLPFNEKINTIPKYFSPRPMTYELFKTGFHWAKVYDFKFWWVFEPGEKLTRKQKQERMMNELQYSILGVAGWAWSKKNGKYFTDGPDIHWFNVFRGIKNVLWKTFDTYPDENGSYVKDLEWEYDFGYCMAYSLTRKVGSEDIEFKPEDAPEVKWEYTKYLIWSFFNRFTKK